LNYQGKEQTTILQAPTKKALKALIRSNRSYAKSHGMEHFRILESGKDPDGGYRAVISSHNLNPITWIKSKIGSSESKAAASAQLEADREKAEEKRKRKYEEEAARHEKEFARQKAEAERAELRQIAAEETKSRAQAIRESKTATATAKKATFKAEHPNIVKVSEGVKKAGGVSVKAVGSGLRKGTPVVAKALGKGAISLVSGLASMSRNRGVVRTSRKYGSSGELLEEEVEREPSGGIRARGFSYTGTGLYGSMESLRAFSLPGGGAPGLDLSHLRSLMLPGAGSPIKRQTLPKVEDLTKTQEEVYDAVLDRANTTAAIAVQTDLKESTIKKALKALEKKGLLE